MSAPYTRRLWPLEVQIAIVVIVATLAAPSLTVVLFRSWPPIARWCTWGSPEHRVERYIRARESVAAGLVGQPGIYRVDLVAAGDHVRVEGLVEDARRFLQVEHALDDAYRLPQPPEFALRIRNGQDETSVSDAGYVLQRMGRALIVFAIALLATWALLVGLGLACVSSWWRRGGRQRTLAAVIAYTRGG